MSDQPNDPNHPYDPNQPQGSFPASQGSSMPNAPQYQHDTAGSYGQPGMQPSPGQPSASKGLAIGSLVTGILSIPLGCCSAWGGIVLGIAAIVLAVMHRKKVAQGAALPTPFATAGMITGIIGLLIALAMVILGLVLGTRMEACNSKQSDPTAYQKCIMDQLNMPSPTATR